MQHCHSSRLTSAARTNARPSLRCALLASCGLHCLPAAERRWVVHRLGTSKLADDSGAVLPFSIAMPWQSTNPYVIHSHAYAFTLGSCRCKCLRADQRPTGKHRCCICQ